MLNLEYLKNLENNLKKTYQQKKDSSLSKSTKQKLKLKHFYREIYNFKEY